MTKSKSLNSMRHTDTSQKVKYKDYLQDLKAQRS